MAPRQGRSALTLVLLKYPLFVLMAVAAAGFAAWWWMRTPYLPLFGPPTEAHRPALKAKLGPALKRFFADPTFDNFTEAREIARQYRRSFPDATRDDELMDPAETIRCNVPLECAPRQRELEQRRAALRETIERQAAHLPKDSPEQRAAIAAAYVLERRFGFRTVTSMLDGYYERFPGEAKLLALQKGFFRIIDETAVPQNINHWTNDQLLKQYLDKYYDLAARSLKPALGSCDRFLHRDKTDRAGLPPCERAARDYEAVRKRQKEEFLAISRRVPHVGMLRLPEHRSLTEGLMRERADALKKLIAERDADWQFMTTALAKMLYFQ